MDLTRFSTKFGTTAGLILAGAALVALSTAAQAQTYVPTTGSSTGYTADSSGSPYYFTGGTFTTDDPNGPDLNSTGATIVISNSTFTTSPGSSTLSDDGVFANSSDITINSGSFTDNQNQGLFAGSGSIVTINGGDFSGNGQGSLYTQNGTVITVNGGTFINQGTGFYDIFADSGTADVYGGTFDDNTSYNALSLDDGGIVNIYGNDLAFGSGDNGSSTTGTITGFLSDGSAFNVHYNVQDNDGAINLINRVSSAPEPSQVGMLALLALGMGGLMLRARRSRTGTRE